jgi:hypothetical protein
MRELSASEILDVWERGRSTTLPERALDLLVTGGYAGQPESLAVGDRDALLVELRERTFGATISALSSCPSCGELVEVELTTADLPGDAAAGELLELELALGEDSVRFRVPTAGDLVAVGAAADVETGRRILLERCVEATLAPEHEEAVVARMAEADPGAWTELALACPECGHRWTETFDIVSFLWAELDSCAHRLVGDVHSLASAYGWRESDVLALSPSRRQAYLELVPR